MSLRLVIAIPNSSGRTLCALSIPKRNTSAIATLYRLSDRGNGRTVDETEYLPALAVFVEKYEEEHHPIPPVSGVDMLRYLIETRQNRGKASQKDGGELSPCAGDANSDRGHLRAAKVPVPLHVF